MHRKRLINNFFYTFIAIIFIIWGISSYRYMWNKTFEEIDSETKSSIQRTTDYNHISDSSTSSPSVPNQPASPIDIYIQPRVLNLNGKGNLIISWIKLPEEHDPQDIAAKSLELSVVSCPKCKIIYPICQSLVHRQYLTVFPRQHLIEKIERMNLDLPTKLKLKIYGELNDGTPFKGLETIRIIKQKK